MHEQRIALDEERMALDEQYHEERRQLENSPMGQDSGAWERLDRDHQNRMQDIDARYKALDEQAHSYWNDRQRSELDDRRREFEEEWERRRNEEGEHFDESVYEFEKSMHEQRIALDEERMALDEQYHEERRQLENSPMGQDSGAWERLDRDHHNRMQDIDARYQACLLYTSDAADE